MFRHKYKFVTNLLHASPDEFPPNGTALACVTYVAAETARLHFALSAGAVPRP